MIFRYLYIYKIEIRVKILIAVKPIYNQPR